jgi:hypothetical protein
MGVEGKKGSDSETMEVMVKTEAKKSIVVDVYVVCELRGMLLKLFCLRSRDSFVLSFILASLIARQRLAS